MATLARSRGELDRLADELGHVEAGGLQVTSASVESMTDSTGDAALRATLVVPEPAGDTWPVDTYLALRRAVNDVATQMGFDEWVYVDLSAPSDLQDQDDADDGDPETDAAVDARIAEQSVEDPAE
jgi:hypothetical protein